MKQWIELHRPDGGVVYIAPSHVTAIEGKGHYSVVFLGGAGSQMVTESPAMIFKLLCPGDIS